MVNLFPHQKEALAQTEGFKNIAIYHDMGLGKTFTGSEAMIRFGCKVNLIVCQKSKINDWMEHFKNNYRGHKLMLANSKSFDIFVKYCIDSEFNGDFPVFGIINYELLWRRKQLSQLSGFTLMLDESSLIQNMKAKQTKFIMNLKPDHVILLSGTPVGGKYENLLSQCHLLGWDISETLYNNTYVNWKLTEDDGSGIRHKIVNKEDPYKNIERLKSKLRKYGAVFKKTEECFDLPEQVFQKIMVEVPMAYHKFRKNHVVVIGGDELIGDTKLTRMLYSRQICGQYNQVKFEAFEDILNSTQDRIIVFYNFDAELFRLKEICLKNERSVSQINGHTKDLTAFKEESNSVCLCQYKSASKGMNLQEYGCNKIVYFTLPLGSEDFEQSKKRIHRIGQEKTCFYYLLLSAGTIEEDILHTLEERKDFTDELFKD